MGIPTRCSSLAVGVLAIASAASAQEPRAGVSRLTHDQAASDARTFVRLLESSHPDPYTNLGGKVEFKRRAAALVADIPSDGLPVESLATRLGMFLAPLKDAHTRVTPHNDVWRGGGGGGGGGSALLAVRFKIASDAIFLAAADIPSLSGHRGYKVRSVNGQPLSVLLQRLGSQIAAENTLGLYRAMINVLQNADLIRRLAPPSGALPPQEVVFGLESPNGGRVTRQVGGGGTHPTDPIEWRDPPMQWMGLDRSNEMFYYRFLDHDRTAYFRVSSMGGREASEAYYASNIGTKDEIRRTVERYHNARGLAVPADLEQGIRALPSVVEIGWKMLEEMKRKGTDNLIFDLRGNGGGMTGIIYPVFYAMYGDEYFAKRFPNQSTTVASQIYMDKYNLTQASERAKDPDFEIGEYRFSTTDNMPVSSPDADGLAAWARGRREARLKILRERRHSFLPMIESLDGKPLYRPKKVVVLCDPATFSAAFQMAFYLHGMGAKLVGVTSAQSPNTFMEVTPFTLPISGIAGSISNSTQVFMPETPRADRLPVDFEATYAVFKRYRFDEETILRYALDRLKAGKI